MLPTSAAQRARPRRLRALFAGLALAAAASCQSYNERVAVAVDAFERGAFARAEAAFDEEEV
ncbi:MAG: hypothetical protein VX460_02045, partial [Planctomycetota bacterium]|nr:hypothetical protein [Planctomycetota bacterium]